MSLSPLPRVPFGRIHSHVLDFDGALDRIVALCGEGQGGYVLTPNVDHVVLAEHDDGLAEAYQKAPLSLVDGMPLVWLSRLMGTPLPQKISGSDLVRPLATRAQQEGLSLFLLGAKEGVAGRASAILQQENPGLVVKGTLSPPLGFERDVHENERVLRTVQEARPDLLFVALGAPKQELWLSRHMQDLAPTVGLGIGATLDFIAGEVRRAPPWMSNNGLEWLYRLLQEPARMADRYLVRDRAILSIAWRTWQQQRARRS